MRLALLVELPFFSLFEQKPLRSDAVSLSGCTL